MIGEMPSTKLSEAEDGIHITEYSMKLPDTVDAVKLHYSVYKDRTQSVAPSARGELWIED
jgi:hypothetical protein